MPRYKSFVFNNTQGRRRFLLGDYVSVTNASPYSNICTAKLGRASIKRKRDWVAHIVDIRGTSPVDVHALVIWMYWPEALPRRGKRGKEYQENELVASNHLGVIDVRDVDRVVPLKVLRKTRNDTRSQRFIWKDFFDCMHGSIIENYAR
ncbi:hypothetical protein AU210_016416 [Fusarium oxysporum f. sp. radicis-cucumerinum]|uniref:BAH domain-containing protein n=1 Tax=Fusarium oxysporum f. sp. radicis-cucumerinum TaxID=327505 RepID=A0A2H3G2Y1_FUSOX|nr:hypothetical protein AU210_016728 [Fusarium oxysporum f. sp. radicis-cucumerinum]PCD21454.1 hypothetical protein AU210_016416 [Fusarium oxysporum f. sp. radicis-cucumerinum]